MHYLSTILKYIVSDAFFASQGSDLLPADQNLG